MIARIFQFIHNLQNFFKQCKYLLNYMYYYSLKCVLILCFCTWNTTKGSLFIIFFTTQVVSNQEGDPGDNTGLAAGAGVGGAVLVILVIIGVIVFLRYRQIFVWTYKDCYTQKHFDQNCAFNMFPYTHVIKFNNYSKKVVSGNFVFALLKSLVQNDVARRSIKIGKL